MAVLRINKTTDYTVMSNAHFKEKEMSLKAKGLLSLMLSLPDNWDYSIAGLVAICKENETAIKSTLNELKSFGYLIVTKKMPNETESGRIEYEYNIYEQPQGKQGKEKQGVENLPIEHQGIENQGQLNTNIPNTKKQKTKELNNKDISTEFETLWKMYPRKLGKPKALKAYEKARKKGVTFEQVKQGVENYCEYIKATKTATEFVKHGSTWFGNECWNDEYDLSNNAATIGANGIAISNENSDLDEYF
jgi:hypothetical protein